VLVIVQTVGVVVVGNLLVVSESGESMPALGAVVIERLVPDELARVGLGLAVALTGGDASCMYLFLVMNDIVMAHLREGRHTR
tara:strand:- start:255 stop:503 length:249 start_codon:yes stop_codon:yes gene_type:complete